MKFYTRSEISKKINKKTDWPNKGFWPEVQYSEKEDEPEQIVTL